MSRHLFGGRKKNPMLPPPEVPPLSDPAFPEIAPWVWWLLGAVGLGIRLAFILKGNIAFNSDEAGAGLWFKKWGAEGWSGGFSLPADLGGLRLVWAALFYVLTGGWVYFNSLAAVVITSCFSAVWVYWVYRKISKMAAFGAALALAFPPVCVAYYSTHMERRIETLLWASLLVAFSGSWFKRKGTALLGGLVVGWAFWCEPFILFFALPVAAYETWRHRRSGPAGRSLFGTAAGLLLGGVSGFIWNAGFKGIFMNARLSGWEGARRHLDLLWSVFPQFWNGNFPFGYLQASSFGRSVDPVHGGMFAAFLAFWTLTTFSSAVGGCAMLARQKDRDGGWMSALIWLPAALYFLFFVLSAQVWDATSFRYLDYWVVFAAIGWGLAFHYLFRWKRGAAVLALACFVLAQGFILAEKFRQLPAEFPAVRIVRNLESLGFKECLANYWVSETGRYLSNGKVSMAAYKSANNLSYWREILGSERIGLVVLEGLDSAGNVDAAVRSLDRSGFGCTKTWPMLGGWYILEFHKKTGIHDSRNEARP